MEHEAFQPPAQTTTLTIPIAIVIAGVLIAGAVYLGTSKGASTTTGNNQQEKLEAKETGSKQRHTKKILQWIGWNALGIAIVGGLVWLVASQHETPESDIVSRSGFHWHPELAIYVIGG